MDYIEAMENISAVEYGKPVEELTIEQFESVYNEWYKSKWASEYAEKY